jgi:hypothetical protein
MDYGNDTENSFLFSGSILRILGFYIKTGAGDWL